MINLNNNTAKKTLKNENIFIFILSLIGMFYLSFLTYVEVFNVSIEFCENACNYSTSYILLSSVNMYLMGIVFFLILSSNLLNKQNFNIVFFSGLIFELIQFGNLYILHDTFCIKCAIVVLILMLIGFIVNKERTTSIFLVIYFSLAIQINYKVDFETLGKNRYVLIEQDNCKFCEESKVLLKEYNIEYYGINAKASKDIIDLYEVKKVPFLIVKENNLTHTYEGANAIKEFLSDNFTKIENKNNFKKNIENNSLVESDNKLDFYLNEALNKELQKDGCMETNNKKEESCD